MKESDSTRRDFLKALTVVGLGFAEGCSKLTPEEIEKMPLTQLEEIINNPEKYLRHEKIKTRGYIMETGERISNDNTPVMRPQYGPAWQVTFSRHTYKITGKADGLNGSLDAVSENKLVNLDSYPIGYDPANRDKNMLERKFPKPEVGQSQEVVGKLHKVKTKDGVKYIFEIGRIISAEKPETKR